MKAGTQTKKKESGGEGGGGGGGGGERGIRSLKYRPSERREETLAC